MRRKILILFGIVLIAVLGYLFLVLPAQFDAKNNAVSGAPLAKIRPDIAKLHAGLNIADLHGDTLLWQRSLLDPVDYGHIDLPRLEAGNVALQIFSSVTKTPRGQNYDSNSADSDNITILAIAQAQPIRTWFSLTQRSLWHAQKLQNAVDNSGGRLRLIRSARDIDQLLADRAAGKQVTGALFSAEGLHNLEGESANLDVLHDAGLRMAGLVHFFDNRLGGSMHGAAKGGLTDFGKQILRRMEAKGVIVDIAHSSHDSVADILQMAQRPVVSSHGGVQAVCKVNRNLTDTEIRGVAATGGIIGIGYWEGATCSTDPAQIARSIAHVRNLVGVDHVALGSDFDGLVTTGFDTANVVQVTQALSDIGFTKAEITAVMGGNALRIIKQGIEPLPKAAL